MFSKDLSNTDSKIYDVLEKTKGSANVVIGNGVIIKGEILEADTVQIDGTADVTMTTEMTAYRQALRDVPTQAGWPTNISWPTAP